MSIKKIMHKDRHGAQVSIEFGEGGAASQLVEQFLGGMGVPAMQDIPQEHPGDPKGTDTVPAWLTPGEFVMNAEATRMFEPQIEEMNNAGRAVQRQQGGSIPEYKSYGGSIPEYHDDGGMAGYSHEDMLDAVMMVESGGNFNAVSPAGAQGPYQIMPNTAAKPGYGVTPIAPEDVFDPQKSRVFASQYLKGLARQYPDATQQEIFQMYNAGAGRVNSANAFNPLSQETIDYPLKIQAELERMAKLAAANGSVDDDSDVPLDYNTVPVPEEVVTMESLRSPTSDKDVLASLKSAQATAASTPEEEGAFDFLSGLRMPAPPSYYGDPQGTKDIGVLENKDDVQATINSDRASLETELIEGTGTGGVFSRGVKDIQSDIEDVNERQRRLDSSLERSSQKEITNKEGDLKAKQQRVADLRAAGLNKQADALEVELETSETKEPKEPDENNIDAIFKAASAEQARIDAEAAKKDDPDASPSAWDKVKDFFKEGLGTVLDKGALSEAATLYLGSRALGYDHEGSLNFVTKRYGKGIENKLAIANKAVGKYTNDSITKYKDTGNLMDLTLIPKLIDQNKPVTFVVPETGELLNLNTMKDENGLTVIVNEKNEPVNTRSLLKADEYRSRSSSNISKITPLLEGAKKKMKANNTDDDFDADGLFNTAAVAQAISNHALSNKFNDAEVSKLTPYVTTFIQKARSMGGDTYKDVNDMDLAEMAITQGIARREEPNLFETGIRGEVDPVLWQTEIDLEFPDIDKKFNAREKALMFKTIYQYGYSQRTPKEIEMYRSKAVAGSNGFLVYLKEASQEDGGKWKPKFNALLNNK